MKRLLVLVSSNVVCVLRNRICSGSASPSDSPGGTSGSSSGKGPH